MKFSCQLVSSTLAVLVLSACSNNAVERKQADDDFAYLNAQSLQDWKYPRNALPESSSLYQIPQGQYKGSTGTDVDIRPPQEILTLLSGVRVDQRSNTAELWMVKNGTADKIWREITQWLNASGASFTEQSSSVIQTSWVTWSPEDEPNPVLGRYQFEKLQKTGQDGIQVKLLELKQGSQSLSQNESMVDRYTAVMANNIVTHYDDKQRADEANRIRSQMNNIAVQMGSDRSGLPVIIARAPYNVLWERLPDAIIRINMAIQDRTQSQGSIKVDYTTPDDDVWASFRVEPLPLKKGSYTLLLGDLGNRTSINLTDSKGKPVSEDTLKSFADILSKLLER
ncbi:outer membrane protein assembly factor BamC [Vibrio sp.]|nr:outer membrane protein assembly factor BamC [Vibrio sp.]